MRISTYLTFNGNCREAMHFYKHCLGGQLTIQTIGESPLAEKMPEKMKSCILHASLEKNQLLLLASDMVSEQGLQKGNSVSLMLNCTSEEEIKNCFEKLSLGGKTEHALENTFWGALIGDLTDKYGHHWLLHYDKNKQS